MKKYYLLIKEKWQNKLSLPIFLGKALEKQTKVIEDPGQKQIKTLEKENS